MESRFNVIIVIILLILASCGDSTFLSELNNPESSIKILSHKSGNFLDSDESIQFKIVQSEDPLNPLTLQINVYSINDDIVGKKVIEDVSINEELSLSSLNFLETGFYKVHFNLLEDTTVTLEENFSFFYLKGKYDIKSIETHPSTVSPDSPFILKALIQSPEGENPYLRWSINGKVLAQGTKSQGWNNLLWTSPKEEGVYSILLELFPIAPPSTRDFHYKSDIKMEIEIYVIKDTDSVINNLNPAASYYTLFHFDKSLKDLGDKSISTSSENETSYYLSKINKPVLREFDEKVFYEISPQNGFKYKGLVIPESQGLISPFTLTLGLSMDHEVSENIISYLSDNGSFGFSLYIDNKAFLILKMKGTEDTYINSGISVKTFKERFLLSLSIIPSETKIDVIWYINGKALSTSAFNWDFHQPSSQGTLKISGEQGFTGTLDELGIFYKDSYGRLTPDDQILKYSLPDLSRLLMISGFDGFHLHEGLTLSGEYKLEKSLLSLSQNASLIFPSLSLESQAINFSLQLFEILNNNTIITLSFGNQANSNIKIYLSDKIYISINNETYPILLRHKVLNLKLDKSSIEFVSEHNKTISLKLNSQNSNSVIIKMVNKSEWPLVIDSFTVTR